MLRSMVAWAVVAGLVVSGGAALEAARGERQQALAGSMCPGPGAHLGKVAFATGRRVGVVDLATCRRWIVARGVAADRIVRWSPDGRYLAFGHAAVVPASGGRVSHPLGLAVSTTWTWAGNEDVLLGITRRGEAVYAHPAELGRPAGRRHVLMQHGATGLVAAPRGHLVAIARSAGTRRRLRQEAWIASFASGRTRRVWRAGAMGRSGPSLAGFSPDLRWLLLWPSVSPSIDADGGRLLALPTRGGSATQVTSSLMYRDHLSWCGRRLIVTAGGFRVATAGEHLVTSSPSRWRTGRLASARRLSWSSIGCSPSGDEVAAAAGPRPDELGRTHRSIRLVPSGGGGPRRLTAPSPRHSDELPRFSSDGRWIAFVRTDERDLDHQSGSLYALRLRHDRPARLLGPIAPLGRAAGPYYGHYDWYAQTDWWRPR